MPNFTVIQFKKRFLIFSSLVIVMMVLGYLVGKPFHLGQNLGIEKPNIMAVLEHNSGVALLLIFGSMLTWGICSYVVLSINSLVAGFIAANLSVVNLFGVFFPYVFLELLSYILFAVVGVCMADNLKVAFKSRQKRLLLSYELEIKALIAIGIIILAIAAGVEGIV